MTSASKYPATLSGFNPASALREWTNDPIRTNWTGPREKGITSMSISMHQSSVGVFTHFLSSLSDLLDHAAAHAEKRKIDPSILLNARLYPNMYNLARQVGEANRHAVLACALLTGVDAPVFPDSEPDIPRTQGAHCYRKGICGKFAARANQRHRRKGSHLHIPERLDATIYRPITATDFQRAAVLFPRHDGL
jgi:hypothetical protein